jgi:hypothetical protein
VAVFPRERKKFVKWRLLVEYLCENFESLQGTPFEGSSKLAPAPNSQTVVNALQKSIAEGEPTNATDLSTVY